MNKIILSVSIAFATFSFVLIQNIFWTSDAAHSRLGFSISHMGIADINGDFKKFNVKISTPNGEFDDASIEMSAEVSSVSTGIEMRDNHLKTADFFDALQYPTLSFKSTEVKKLKNREYLVKGNLTMHGITKPVTLSAFHNGTVKNESGINIAGFKLTGIIKRSDFGVGQPSPGLSDEVKLICDLEVTQD